MDDRRFQFLKEFLSTITPSRSKITARMVMSCGPMSSPPVSSMGVTQVR